MICAFLKGPNKMFRRLDLTCLESSQTGSYGHSHESRDCKRNRDEIQIPRYRLILLQKIEVNRGTFCPKLRLKSDEFCHVV